MPAINMHGAATPGSLTPTCDKADGVTSAINPKTHENQRDDFASDVVDRKAPTVATIDALPARINELHRLACLHAEEAIDHAKQAGNLLLQVKADLPHGKFTAWLHANIEVSPRQAQRYMAAALGKPTTVRCLTNATPVSDLAPLAVLDRHRFEADPSNLLIGCVNHLAGPFETSIFVVEPSKQPGFYYVRRLGKLRGSDGTATDYMTGPIAARAVGYQLHLWGAPAAVEWDRVPTDPVPLSFDAPPLGALA